MIVHDGKVVLRYYQPVPKYVKIGNKDYICDVRYGVSLLFVDESEAPALLAAEGGCCGGKRKMFSECGQEALSVFLTGNR